MGSTPKSYRTAILATILSLGMPVLGEEPPKPAPEPDRPPAAGAAAVSNEPATPANPDAAPDARLPQNPSAPGELLLLPGEMLLQPPVERPPVEAGAAASPADRYKLRLEPVIRPVLPPLSELPGGAESPASALRVRVKKFRFQGNHAFSDAALLKVVAKYAGRDLASNDLEEARQALTLKYVNAGYVSSGAVLPDQDLKDGLVIFQIVEGRLTRVAVRGAWWFRPWWLRHALRQYAGDPVNLIRLKTGLQLLRQDPNIRQINAELEPGDLPGESILAADVKENQPFRFGLEFSNKRPPSVGAESLDVIAQDLNLTGHSDVLSVDWGLAHAASDNIDRWTYAGNRDLAGSYDFPVTPWKTRMVLHASRSDEAIVEAPFTVLGINSKLVEYGAALKQPVYESLGNVFTVSAGADWRENDAFLLGQPFDLSPGSINGETKVFVLRFTLDYLNRSEQHVLALRSTVSVGLDAFGATRNDQQPGVGAAGPFQQRQPDGQFVSWLGQSQYIQRLFNTDNLAVLRLNGQWSPDPLFALEQFSLGGASSVRGYRENQLLRDNGLFASLEFRIPVLRNKAKTPTVALAPFVDFGFGWDNVEYIGPRPATVDNGYETLSSVGVGIIFTPVKYVTGQIYWGYALNRKNTVPGGQNLQDYGLTFSLTIHAF